VKLNAGVVVAVATLVVNSGERFPAEKLLTVELDVLQVEHEIAPVEEIEIGDVPLSPAVPTDAIGMAVGR